jgi:dCTP deaminase
MYLSDVDLREALAAGELIVDPLPEDEVGPTSIDLHLGPVEEAQVWDRVKLEEFNREHGLPPRELNIARMSWGKISRKYLMPPPGEAEAGDATVFRRERAIVLRPQGFVLWQTREIAGTPVEDPKYICFIEGKSTRARSGLVVHLTAPTVHAGWHGNLTLEMTNCGPFDLVLNEGDAIAQLMVARISRPPELDVKLYEKATFGQKNVKGADISGTQ